MRALDLKKGITRTDRSNAIDLYLEEDATEAELKSWRLHFNTVPVPLSRAEKHEWLARFDGVALSSDAFIPFRDNIDRAARSGVRYVVQTGGSSRDEGIIRAADEYGMVMVFTTSASSTTDRDMTETAEGFGLRPEPHRKRPGFNHKDAKTRRALGHPQIPQITQIAQTSDILHLASDL